jgi:hypothetical protein
MRRMYPVIAIALFAGIILIGCCASAVVMPTATFRISLERNGTPFNTFADFSAVCYGHSFLNVAGDNHFANVTPEYPEPLSRVLDLQVYCNPPDGCRAQSYDTGDPERSEWCELNGTTTGGDPIRANVTKENLKVNCSARESATDYRRCNAEAQAKNPCDDLVGSKKLHCTDSLREDVAACLVAVNGSENRSSNTDKWCEIRFNLPSSGAAGPGTVKPGDTDTRTAATAVHPQGPVESLYCSILQVFGVMCE